MENCHSWSPPSYLHAQNLDFRSSKVLMVGQVLWYGFLLLSCNICLIFWSFAACKACLQFFYYKYNIVISHCTQFHPSRVRQYEFISCPRKTPKRFSHNNKVWDPMHYHMSYFSLSLRIFNFQRFCGRQGMYFCIIMILFYVKIEIINYEYSVIQ